MSPNDRPNDIFFTPVKVEGNSYDEESRGIQEIRAKLLCLPRGRMTCWLRAHCMAYLYLSYARTVHKVEVTPDLSQIEEVFGKNDWPERVAGRAWPVIVVAQHVRMGA